MNFQQFPLSNRSRDCYATVMSADAIMPIYVLHGKDAFLRDQARRQVVSRIIGDADPQLCISDFDASIDFVTVLDELRTLPFLAPHRVVIIRDAETFVSANRDKLENYFDKPIASASLILLVSTWNKSTKLAKKLASKKQPPAGMAISCDAPEGAELVGWVRQAAKSQGKNIEPAAASMLATTIGSDLASLTRELEKLAIYADKRPAITTQDVTDIVVGNAANPKAFAITNAIQAGDIKTALKELSLALRTRGAEFMILGQIRWYLQKALAGPSGGQYGGYRSHSPRPAKRDRRKLQADVRKLIAADLGMKSGLTPKAAMQQLIIELCS
ncbi:MAG: DNA polymerase III subunit delta [Phycisphaerae bacterium]|nr:DNA polymerase III subunit delta [Phycisphaerae bacterium]